MKAASVDRLLRTLGHRVGELRRQRELTQEQLAERLRLSPRYVQQIEGGHANPSIRVLCEIAGLLRVDLEDLFRPTTTERSGPGRPKRKRAVP